MQHNYLSLTNRASRAIADLFQDFDDPKVWTLTRISVPPFDFEGHALRGKGLARGIMEQILSDADKERVILRLYISPGGGLTKRQLAAWYKRLGFDRNKTYPHWLVRLPRGAGWVDER